MAARVLPLPWPPLVRRRRRRRRCSAACSRRRRYGNHRHGLAWVGGGGGRAMGGGCGCGGAWCAGGRTAMRGGGCALGWECGTARGECGRRRANAARRGLGAVGSARRGAVGSSPAPGAPAFSPRWQLPVPPQPPPFERAASRRWRACLRRDRRRWLRGGRDKHCHCVLACGWGGGWYRREWRVAEGVGSRREELSRCAVAARWGGWVEMCVVVWVEGDS